MQLREKQASHRMGENMWEMSEYIYIYIVEKLGDSAWEWERGLKSKEFLQNKNKRQATSFFFFNLQGKKSLSSKEYIQRADKYMKNKHACVEQNQ